MDEFLNALLQRVNSGEASFSPDDDSAAAKARFQPLAKAFIHAEKIGMVEGIYAHKERSTGLDLYDFVRIEGGLTYRGMREASASFAS